MPLLLADVWIDILFDKFDICVDDFLTKLPHECIQANALSVEFPDTCLQMPEVQGNLISDEPFGIIPVPAFHAVLPYTVDQRVHLAGVEVRKRKAAHHEGIWLQKELLLGAESKRRFRVQLNLYLHLLLGAESDVIRLRAVFQESGLDTSERLLLFFRDVYIETCEIEFLFLSRSRHLIF